MKVKNLTSVGSISTPRATNSNRRDFDLPISQAGSINELDSENSATEIKPGDFEEESL
ncbi:MAG: hypothetical protein GY786_10175 [Proteobacteria bacterium]|nr:hypothetical protein [Pseudomonadota bacterium]